MPDSCVIEAEKPSPAGASRDPASRFPAVIALAFALAFALVLLLDAGRAVPMLERQAVAFDWPWLRPVAAGLRSVAEASGLAALSGMESRVVAALSPEWRIGATPAPGESQETSRSGVKSAPPVPGAAGESGVLGADVSAGMGGTDSQSSARGTDPAGTGAPDADHADPDPLDSASSSVKKQAGAVEFSVSALSPVDAALAAFRDATGTTRSGEPGEVAPSLVKPGRTKPCVLLVGDSMMMEGFGPVLQRALRARPDLTVIREGKYSTGLSRLDYFDWGSRLAELVQRDAPDLVVICLGANDPQDIIGEDGKRHHADSASWAEMYRQRAEKLLRVATAGGAKVIWVGLPIMSKEPYSTRIRRLSDLQKAACASYVRPGEASLARFVDTLAALADEHGAYAAFAAGSDGRAVRLRYKDKVHVTEEGGRRMTRRVLPFIFATLGLPERLPEAKATSPAGGRNSSEKMMHLDRLRGRP